MAALMGRLDSSIAEPVLTVRAYRGAYESHCHEHAQVLVGLSIAILVIVVAVPVLLIFINAFWVDGHFNVAERQ